MIEDKRIVRSRKALMDALVHLLSEKTLEKITVKDLIIQADVSRSTFYRNFVDKYDFLDWTMNELLIEGIQKQSWFKQSPNSDTYFENFFQYIYEHRVYFKAFINSVNWQQFRDKFVNNALMGYKEILQDQNIDIPIDLLASYIVGAHTEVVSYWLKSNIKYSPEFMAELFKKLTENGVLKIVNINGESINLPS